MGVGGAGNDQAAINSKSYFKQEQAELSSATHISGELLESLGICVCVISLSPAIYPLLVSNLGSLNLCPSKPTMWPLY